MSDTGNTIGRLQGQVAMSSGPAAAANPPVTAETPEEEGWFAGWWNKTENELRAAGSHPLEAVKGATKGIANIPSDLSEMLMKGAALQDADDIEQTAAMQRVFGQTQSAEALTQAAQDVRTSANSIDLPKFQMSNPAQAGGDKIVTVASLFAGGAGLVRGGIRSVSALGEAAEIVDGGATVSKNVATAGRGLQGESAAANGINAAHATGDASVTVKDSASGKIASDGAKVEKALPPLRQAYVDEVNKLKDVANSMRKAGSTPEQIARRVHQMRRDLGVKYKNLTPPDKLEEIYARNIERYQDKLGPSIEWLRDKGKSWDQIIESATRPC